MRTIISSSGDSSDTELMVGGDSSDTELMVGGAFVSPAFAAILVDLVLFSSRIKASLHISSHNPLIILTSSLEVAGDIWGYFQVFFVPFAVLFSAIFFSFRLFLVPASFCK